MAFLETVGESGLDPADYSISVPAKDVTASISAGANASGTPVEVASASTSDAYQRAQMQFELALSAKVLAYVQDTTRGRVDPNRLSGYHDFKRKTVNLAPVLKLAGLSPDIAAYLRSREPSNAEYLALKAELARLRSEGDAANTVKVPADLVLKPGNSSGDMASVVKAIEHRASPAFKAEHAAIISGYQQTPDYTPDLVDLVKAFQSENGLKADGVIGRATVRAMVGESNDARIAKVQVAMEQIRWLPADLGQRYVLINQPAFMAYYHNDGQEQFGMKVVVGSKANQTYFFGTKSRPSNSTPIGAFRSRSSSTRCCRSCAAIRPISTVWVMRCRWVAVRFLLPASTGSARPTPFRCVSRQAATMHWAT